MKFFQKRPLTFPYEDEHYPIDATEAIRFIMEQMRMGYNGLDRILSSRSRASQILHKKSKLSMDIFVNLTSILKSRMMFLIEDYELAS